MSPIHPSTSQEVQIMVDTTDFNRLEQKVDKMTEALTQLLLFEERQKTQSIRIGELEKDLAIVKANYISLERKVDQWINRGIGVWGVVALLWSAYVKFGPH